MKNSCPTKAPSLLRTGVPKAVRGPPQAGERSHFKRTGLTVLKFYFRQLTSHHSGSFTPL